MSDFIFSPPKANVGTIPIHTSLPDKLVIHSITDEELTLLCEKSKDFLQEILWASVGVFFGAMPTAVVSLFWAPQSTDGINIQVSGLIHVILFFVGMVAMLITGWLTYRRSRRSTTLETAIRNRTG